MYVTMLMENVFLTVEDWIEGGHPASWNCADCGKNTAPGCLNAVDLVLSGARYSSDFEVVFSTETELFQLRDAVWRSAAPEDARLVLCIGCVEKRLGRKLKPKDFQRNSGFENVPGSARLLSRRGRKKGAE